MSLVHLEVDGHGRLFVGPFEPEQGHALAMELVTALPESDGIPCASPFQSVAIVDAGTGRTLAKVSSPEPDPEPVDMDALAALVRGALDVERESPLPQWKDFFRDGAA